MRWNEGESDSCVPVCLPTRDLAERELLMTRYHTVSGWSKRTTGGNEDPVLAQCSHRSQFNFTGNMLCAGGDDGSPLGTLYGSTRFLIGLVGWGRGCPNPGYYGVYTNVGNFADWANGIMATAGEKTTEKANSAMLEQKVL